MVDPLSIIAIGAAVGGAAGKLAEKAWDSSEVWLRERFGSHRQEAQQRARNNAAQFVQHLAIQVGVFEHDRRLSEDEIENEESNPQFARLLEQTILNAAETNDESKHDLLARLVANRLVSQSETTLALASQLSSDAIARSTRRQLQLMALACFLNEVRPRDPLQPADYRLWIQVFLRPFEEFHFMDIDARHLV
ncbi:MAG: hypothetical protein QOE82_3012, partial [Thermoanaerobaculia bacterium]|nr:hypothetical protein [Thermoanaerobaculia bacterium]